VLRLGNRDLQRPTFAGGRTLAGEDLHLAFTGVGLLYIRNVRGFFERFSFKFVGKSFQNVVLLFSVIVS